MNVPVIRLEVEGMKHTIQMMLGEHMAKMDADIQAAVTKFCTPGNITEIIEKAAADEIKRAIQSEISDFYRYGNGRQAIRDAVLATLEKKE